MLPPTPLLPLWPTPLGLYRYTQADAINDLLVRVFESMRATDPAARDGHIHFYASRDDLLQRIRLPE
jgi:hypothetical protein